MPSGGVIILIQQHTDKGTRPLDDSSEMLTAQPHTTDDSECLLLDYQDESEDQKRRWTEVGATPR